MNTRYYPSTQGSFSPHPRAFVASSFPDPSNWFSSSIPSTSTPGQSNWYLDSAATNHITTDVHHLDSYSPYSGLDQVTVGNGASLPIHHTGKGLLSTPHHTFQLSNVLHIPSMATNLLSVNQLTKDNKCIVTFDADTFVI